jgi:tetratricopeptide (TPR) repeat protein
MQSEEPSPLEISEQLAKMLASDVFQARRAAAADESGRGRAGRLLAFIVDKTLSGPQNDLTEYTIAVAVLGRPRDFDPGVDTIVRVEVARLRSKLDDYYRNSGKTDTILIDVPKGGCVATFLRRPTAGVESPPPRRIPSRNQLRWGGVVLLLCLGAVSAIMIWQRHDNNKDIQRILSEIVAVRSHLGGDDTPVGPDTKINKEHLESLLNMLERYETAGISLDPRSYFEEGNALYAIHNAELAIKKLQIAIRLNPSLAAAHSLLAVVYLFERDDSDLAFKHTCLAITNLNQNDWSTRAQSLTLLGTLNRERGRFDEALVLFQDVQKIYADHNDLRGIIGSHNNIGLVYQSHKDNDKAIEQFRLARDMSRNLGDPVAQARSLLFMGNYFYGLGSLHRNEALDAYTKARDLVKDKVPSLEAAIVANIGNIYFDRGEFDKAESFYKQILWLSPESPENVGDAHNSLGNVYKVKRQWDDAMREFRTALSIFRARTASIGFVGPSMSLRRDDMNVLRSMEDVSIRKGDYAGAIKYGEQELEIDKDSPGAHYNLACAYCGLNDRNMAIREFQKVPIDNYWASQAEPDTDLKCLRGTPLFKEIIRSGKAKTPGPPVVSGALPPLSCTQ